MIKILQDNLNKREELFAVSEAKFDISNTVKNIIDDVRANGDKALYYYAEKFDNAKLSSLRVTSEEIDEAVSGVDPEFLDIIKKAATNIKEFHSKQLRKGFEIDKGDVITGQKIIPLESVGLYVPGGTAVYPSTVLMDAIPAVIAGVERIVMVSPPNKEGKINPVILATAYVAGVTEIYKVGGAGAVAALAYGTDSIPKV
ncbi:MAG: histidinol dehydrogenase, partial [Clostridiales bacterium]|nr:histidinol dehydrogenase [Clostridiales bacterium]